jgi:Rrf2 family transcriptional regulator, nitric oxide-sensitive transcriptional repressor
MRLTLYTDYTLRVMIYLTLRYEDGGVATIAEMAQAYDISRNHLMKIVNELAQSGFIETTRGRAGGARLARAPNRISVGEVVRMAEKDFAVVQCHDVAIEPDCAVFQACNLKRGMRRAVDAFMQELDKITFAEAVSAHSVAESLLGLGEVAVPIALPARGSGRKDKARAKTSRQPPVKRRAAAAKLQ